MIAFRIALAAFVLPIVMFASLAGVAPVDACSADATWDPIANSDVIVGGYIRGYTPAPHGVRLGMFTQVSIDMRVDHVWKGSVPAAAEIVDGASLILEPELAGPRILWAGASGACGVFDEDPSGVYIVAGLSAEPDGSLRTTRLRMFYLSPQPYDPASVRLLSQRIGLPVAGAGKDAAGARNLVEALLAGSAALLVAGIVWRNRLRPHGTGEQV